MPTYLLLALAPLLWAGNWIVGRGMHETLPPIGLNFWRWVVALAVLAALTAPRLRAAWPAVRKDWHRIAVLAALSSALFHCLVYAGLRFTTAINAVLINSVTPVLVLCLSWLVLRETATPRQLVGVVISFAGVLTIVSRADLSTFLELRFNQGDLLILLAMPLWALYTVLLRRWRIGLGQLELLTAISAFAVLLLAPAYLIESAIGRTMPFDLPTAAAVLYVGAFASAAGYLCWNKGLSGVGPNRAGLFLHLLPAYGTLLAIIFLGEVLHLFQVIGIGLILAGIYLSASAKVRTTLGRRAGGA